MSIVRVEMTLYTTFETDKTTDKAIKKEVLKDINMPTWINITEWKIEKE